MTELIKPLPSYLEKESRKPEAKDVIREGNRAAQAAIISETQRRGDKIEYYITADAREFSKIDDQGVISFWQALVKTDAWFLFSMALNIGVLTAVLSIVFTWADGDSFWMLKNETHALKISGLQLALAMMCLGVFLVLILGLIALSIDFKYLAYIKKHSFNPYYLNNLLGPSRTMIGVGGKGLYYVANPWTSQQLKVNLCHFDALDSVRLGQRLLLISRDGGCAYHQNSYEAWGDGYHNGGLESDLKNRIENARK